MSSISPLENGDWMKNPLYYFQCLLHEKLASEEFQQVQDWLEEYPYFPLLYFLKAKHTGQKDSLFHAALVAPNRSLLKAFMDGSLIIRDREFGNFTERDFSEEEKKLSAKDNHLYAIVDFDHIQAQASTQNLPFSVWNQELKDQKDEYINLDIKIRTLKYLGIADKLDRQLSISSAQPKQQEVKESEGVEQMEDDPLALLNTLLKNRPKTMMPEADSLMINPDEMAMKSVDEEESLITETLANLHFRQKNYSMALEMYQQLKLKFPEKSTYFDAQIEKIQGIRWQ